MAWPKINHIKINVFSKKGRLSMARLIAHGDIKGGAWIIGGGDGKGQAGWTGFWVNTAGALDRLAAGTKADWQQDQAGNENQI